MPLYRYIFRRVLFTIPMVLGITIVAFLIANAVPADPINANLPQNALGNERLVNAFRERWGLDKPPVVQYLTYLRNLLQGDMGVSIKTKNPVLEDIRRFLPATVELATLSIVVGLAIGIGFGVVSAVWRNSILDYLVRCFALIGVSFPIFPRRPRPIPRSTRLGCRAWAARLPDSRPPPRDGAVHHRQPARRTVVDLP